MDSDYLPSLKHRTGLTESSRPAKPNLTFIDDIIPRRSTDIHDIWRDSNKDKHGTPSRKYLAYNGSKKRPTSSGSSSSSVSSISYNKGSEVSKKLKSSMIPFKCPTLYIFY